MDQHLKAMVMIVIGALVFFCALIGGVIYESHSITTSPDPVATACALGKEKACTALANRKP